jgi:ATP-dependent exoDNAse (exonuclease V) alpha subunit
VTARNADKNALNEQIRAELKAAGKLGDGYVFVVRESKNLSGEAKRYAYSYEAGDVVFIQRKDMKEMGIKSKGNEFKVVGVDITKNRIEIQDKAGKRFVVNVKEWGDRLSVYKEKKIEVSKGDKVITLKNDKELGVKNGEMWVVEKISEDGTIMIKNEDKVKTFNIKDYNYLDYGYAVTVHKSQGMTVNKVIFDVSAERTHFNEVYTALTRGKVEYSVYTNNKGVFYERMKHEQEKLSTIELSSAELRRAVGESFKSLTSSLRDATSSLKESVSQVSGHSQSMSAGSGRFSSPSGHSEEQSRAYARGR